MIKKIIMLEELGGRERERERIIENINLSQIPMTERERERVGGRTPERVVVVVGNPDPPATEERC